MYSHIVYFLGMYSHFVVVSGWGSSQALAVASSQSVCQTVGNGWWVDSMLSSFLLQSNQMAETVASKKTFVKP